MSREIKFRVWDKVNERMLNIETLCLSFSPNGVLTSIYTYGPDFSNDPEVIGHDEPDLDDVTIEQYTGLDDKNGKPIYEGDIVQYGNEEDMKFSVTFKQGVFYACNTLGSEFMVDTFLGSLAIGNRLKVIGNAHQNPELLEADK
ncbi:YopX family protein [Lentilactobacillus otakiensis]|uniref:YopX family protein n=1 Tax=Lentilactobacillus otakiensis TaxID=481720 RepID=UPI003D183AF2